MSQNCMSCKNLVAEIYYRIWNRRTALSTGEPRTMYL